MARKIHSRLKIGGTLVAETPLHVGGFGESVDTDLPFAQNGKGEWYVPGTSIAGVLRSWCEKNFGEDLTKKLFAPKRERGKEEGYASFVLIEDATIENADKVLTEVRDGVGIDRFYGVAADKAKYDRAVLPRGTKLNFKMAVEVGEDHDDKKTKAIIGNLLAALTESKIRFGAARTRGLGRVKLTGKKKENGEYESEPELKEQSFIGFDNILNLLNDNGNARSIAGLKNATSLSTNSAPRLEINITWKPRLPVMVKAGYDGIGVDMLPLTSGVDKDHLALCLPGSSIKGAMRSHAERIIRTVLDYEAVQARFNTYGRDFHSQLDDIPLVEDLFGAKNKQDNTKGLGALAIDDCYATETMNAKQWRDVEVAVDAKKKENEQDKPDEVSYYRRELWKQLREIDEWKDEFVSKNGDKLTSDEYKKDSKRFRINHQVAIDRWTGGASEGALYSVLAPTKIKWEDIRLTLDFGRIDDDTRLPALMLLLLVLRDVAENRLPFGFATNRGMGEIEVEALCLKGSGFENELSCLNTSLEDGLVLSKGKFVNLDKGLKEKLKTEWETWRNNQ
jgi:CRISPR/Cas system CSM-associated protein Csm3 (group 7 of RAMP superfamily)